MRMIFGQCRLDGGGWRDFKQRSEALNKGDNELQDRPHTRLGILNQGGDFIRVALAIRLIA